MPADEARSHHQATDDCLNEQFGRYPAHRGTRAPAPRRRASGLRPAHARGDVRLVVAAAVRGALGDQAAGAEFSCECVEHVPKNAAAAQLFPGYAPGRERLQECGRGQCRSGGELGRGRERRCRRQRRGRRERRCRRERGRRGQRRRRRERRGHGQRGVVGSAAVIGSAGVALSVAVLGSAGIVAGAGNVGCVGCVACAGCVDCIGCVACVGCVGLRGAVGQAGKRRK